MACTPDGDQSPAQQASPLAEPTAVSAPPSPTQVRGTTVAPSLITRFADRVARPVGLLTELDLRDADAAPSVRDAPAGRAVLVAQVGLFGVVPPPGVRPGVPFLLAPNGEWRRVELADYGIDVEREGELPTALSPDGRTLALGASGRPGRARMVVIDLASGTAVSRRLPAPVRTPAGLQWSPDGGEITWFDRHRRHDYVFDVATGESQKLVGYDAQGADLGADYWGRDDRRVEVLALPDGDGTALRIHEDDAQVDRSLEYPDLTMAWGPAVADELVVWHYRAKTHKRGPAALVAVDPTDGALAGVLSHLDARTNWAIPVEWLSPQDLLVTDYPGGNLWLWSVADRKIVRVGGFLASGVNVDVSPEVARLVLQRAGLVGR